MARRHSLTRITGWSSFFAAALFLALCLWYLPTLLRLDQYRPRFIDLLEKTFHCRAEIGHVRGQLVPEPGLFVSRMALLEDTPAARLLAAGNVHVTVAWRPLLHGELVFTAIRFTHPRLLFHRDVDARGVSHWMGLAALQTQGSSGKAMVDDFDIRKGSLEVWDHSTQPAQRWSMDDVDGHFQLRSQIGALTGKVHFLGPRCLLNLHYQGGSIFPIEARVTDASLAAIPTLMHSSFTALAGTADVLIKARLRPDVEVRVTIPSLELQRMKGVRMRGTAVWQSQSLKTHLESLTTVPMEITVEAHLLPATWNLTGTVKGYDTALVQKLYDQAWLNRLTGGGTLKFSARSGPAKMPAGWTWFVEGTGFTLADSPFRLGEWSAQGNSRTLVVDVRPVTDAGGIGEVVWEKSTGSPDAQLTVNIASVTVRQVLSTFKLQSKPGTLPGDWNPYGYESWVIQKADMESVIHDQTVLEVTDSDIDVAGMHLDLSGTFGLKLSTAPAHIQGDLLNVSLEPLLNSFGQSPAALTGQAQAGFNLTFPLNAAWLHGFSGTVHVDAINGVLRELKTLYRVMSVLNLVNYLKFRLPQVTAQGIEFQSVQGQLQFQNGLLTTDDLFLRSTNLNIGINGAADLLMKRVDVKLRMEMLRFLEDVLKAVPITHWIFKKPNKIFLPLIVNVKGPWENPDVY